MIKIVLLLFLIGHVLGDFYLQSAKLAVGKDKSFNKLLKHSLIYMFSMILVTIPVFSFELLKWAIIISLAHFVVDLTKFLIKKIIVFDHKLDISAYLLDQLIHVAVIVMVTGLIPIQSGTIYYPYLMQYMLDGLSWFLALLIIIKPFSITIKKVLFRYKPDNNEEDEGHPNAGALIGMLERLIILLFLSVGQYSAIGFVLTAKSIARYNKIADDPKFSEYYLLGTLLSSLLVIATYLVILT
ncbi:DUF3307 domain-containing protein [Amphibacillus sp. Q70]|uniref:DUF3307 domain-containing protein n=1 Tax=Amphibacillus sp. Q70 TaxID=3453416 RepID=UPI003F8527BE